MHEILHNYGYWLPTHHFRVTWAQMSLLFLTIRWSDTQFLLSMWWPRIVRYINTSSQTATTILAGQVEEIGNAKYSDNASVSVTGNIRIPRNVGKGSTQDNIIACLIQNCRNAGISQGLTNLIVTYLHADIGDHFQLQSPPRQNCLARGYHPLMQAIGVEVFNSMRFCATLYLVLRRCWARPSVF